MSALIVVEEANDNIAVVKTGGIGALPCPWHVELHETAIRHPQEPVPCRIVYAGACNRTAPVDRARQRSVHGTRHAEARDPALRVAQETDFNIIFCVIPSDLPLR